MALLEWHEGMSVGVSLLDEEHKKIIEALNALYDAIEHRRGVEVLSHTLSGLIAYTTYHFSHEEEIFSHSDYPEKTEHIAIHSNMAKRLSEIHRKSKLGQTEEISVELMIFLKEWLIKHIQGTDMKYIPFVIKNNSKG